LLLFWAKQALFIIVIGFVGFIAFIGFEPIGSILETHQARRAQETKNHRSPTNDGFVKYQLIPNTVNMELLGRKPISLDARVFLP